jgi:predicted methyltransferase
MSTASKLSLWSLGLVALSSCATPHPASPPAEDYGALLAASDRLDSDRALDPGRRPVEMLSFLALKPGNHVAELGAGGGYTTELLARAVGPKGVVYAQNSAILLSFANTPWTTRLKRPAMQNVVRLDREFETPLPPEANSLDLVVINAVYHDTVWMKVDRERMNRAVYEALAPGGAFVIIDSSARAGSGLSDVQTLHRIDEGTVREEVESAGFKLASTSDFLRNPSDTRDWNSSPRAAGERRGTSDRFALRFVKP